MLLACNRGQMPFSAVFGKHYGIHTHPPCLRQQSDTSSSLRVLRQRTLSGMLHSEPSSLRLCSAPICRMGGQQKAPNLPSQCMRRWPRILLPSRDSVAAGSCAS